MRHVQERNQSSAIIRLLALCLVVCPSWSHAAVYQWRDADGTMVYSQLPPPDGRAVREVQPPAPPAITPEQAQRELQQLQDRVQERIQNRQRTADETGKRDAARETRARNCEAARNNLQQIQRQVRLLMDDGQGGMRRMRPAEREQRIEQYQKDVQKYCP